MRIWVVIISITVSVAVESRAQDLGVTELIKEATTKSSPPPASTESAKASPPASSTRTAPPETRATPPATMGSPGGAVNASVGFPEPLGSSGRPGDKAKAASPQRKKALAAYEKGRQTATSKRDYGAALGFFKEALAAESSSTTLYAMAQCRRAMNRPLEAMFTFANALSENEKMGQADKLAAPFVAAAEKHMAQLMERLVAVKVILPKDMVLEEMSVRGFPVVSTDLFGRRSPGILLAGVRSRWIPVSQARFSNDFVFYTRPGKYDITMVLSDGRRLVLEKRLLAAGSDRIDFTKERIPAKLVVENVQPGMQLSLSSENAELVDKEFPERMKAFSLDGLQAGEYTLKVSRDGFEDLDESYMVSNGEETHVFLDLSPKRATRLPKAWKIGLGVGGGVLAAALIATIAIVVSKSNEDATNGSGTVSFSLVNP